MDSGSKAKLVDIIDTLAGILEKCGGPGGKPGPCAGGGRNKPSGSNKPAPGNKPGKKPPAGKPQSRGKTQSTAIRKVSKNIRNGKYDLDTLGGTIKYFASAALRAVDSAIGKVEKAAARIEKTDKQIKSKIKELKDKRNGFVKGAMQRVHRISGIVQRLRKLTKDEKTHLQNHLADEIDGLAGIGEQMYDAEAEALALIPKGE